DVGTGGSCFCLEAIDLSKNVRWQAFDAVELLVHGINPRLVSAQTKSAVRLYDRLLLFVQSRGAGRVVKPSVKKASGQLRRALLISSMACSRWTFRRSCSFSTASCC